MSLVLILYFFSTDITSSLFSIIQDMDLYVIVAWIGPNLNSSFIKENKKLSDGRSILFYHWWPDVISSQFNLTPVSFPECNGRKVCYWYCIISNKKFLLKKTTLIMFDYWLWVISCNQIYKIFSNAEIFI